MPELPEVETVRRSLAPFLMGVSIRLSLSEKRDSGRRLPPTLQRCLTGRTIAQTWPSRQISLPAS